MFVDESGMSLRPFSVRTPGTRTRGSWAPRGQTPVLPRNPHPGFQYSFNWKSLSMVGGITLRTVYFRIFPGSIQSEQVVQFLRDLFRHLPGKVILIWDRLPAHRSKKVRGFLEKYERVRQEFLPAYAPELDPGCGFRGNPMEYVWCQWKTHELPNVCAEELGELSCRTRRALGRIRRRPALIASCWKQSRLPI